MHFCILCMNRNSMNLTWVEMFKMNTKVKVISKFVVDIEIYFFFDP